MRKKLLLVANVAKEHVNKFHIPFIQSFSERGWEVDVACVHDADVPNCHRQFDMVYRRNPFSFATLRGIFQLRKILKESHYDVVHCHTPTGGLVARIATFGLSNKPTVLYSAHGFHFFKGASLLNWLIYFPVEKLLSYFTDYLITINSEDYELACRCFHARAVRQLQGTGVNISEFRKKDEESKLTARLRIRKELSLAADDIVLIYVAELIPNKNQLSLIEMLKVLVPKHPTAKLVLVGPDHYDGAVQRKAEACGLQQHVICTGWRNDVADLLAAADYAVPSSKREGLGLNVIEAMAARLPVIAYDNRGHRDIIQNSINGYIVRNGDHMAMAECISALINNPDKKRELVENAFSSIEKYDISAVLSSLQYIYSELGMD